MLGKNDAVWLCVLAILARGHALVEDLPGMGKTTLAQVLSTVLGLQQKRIQFTVDVMPADVLGMNYWDQRVLNFSQKDQTQILQWFWPDLDASDSVHVALAGVIVLIVSIALLESIRGRMNLTRTSALRDREHLLRGLNWISPLHGFTHASPLKSMSFPNDGLKNSWILTWNDLVHAYDRVHYAGQQDEQRYLRQALWRWQIRAGLEAVKRVLGAKARSGKHG